MSFYEWANLVWSAFCLATVPITVAALLWGCGMVIHEIVCLVQRWRRGAE